MGTTISAEQYSIFDLGITQNGAAGKGCARKQRTTGLRNVRTLHSSQQSLVAKGKIKYIGKGYEIKR